jgi:hypothetical protein
MFYIILHLRLKTFYARVQMDEPVNDTDRTTCAASYVIAVNSVSMAYLILKVICHWKNKDRSIQKWCLFYSRNKIVQCLIDYPKHVIIFLMLHTSNRLPRLSRKRWIRTHYEWNTLINASFSKMQSVLAHRLWFRSHDRLFVTNTANSSPLLSGWRKTVTYPGNETSN